MKSLDKPWPKFARAVNRRIHRARREYGNLRVVFVTQDGQCDKHQSIDIEFNGDFRLLYQRINELEALVSGKDSFMLPPSETALKEIHLYHRKPDNSLLYLHSYIRDTQDIFQNVYPAP